MMKEVVRSSEEMESGDDVGIAVQTRDGGRLDGIICRSADVGGSGAVGRH